MWKVRSTAVQRLLEALAPNYLVTIGILPNVNFVNLNRVVNSVISARLHTDKLKANPAKKKKTRKNGGKSAVAALKDVRQFCCVFQDTESPESLTILRKSTKVLGSIRRVPFTKATQRYENIRENKGPSLEKFKRNSSSAQSLRSEI